MESVLKNLTTDLICEVGTRSYRAKKLKSYYLEWYYMIACKEKTTIQVLKLVKIR